MDEDNKDNTQNQTSQESQPEKLSLSSFIEKNYKLLSVLGIFTALTVFSSNLSFKWISSTLSFLFLTITVLIWLEIWAKFPKSGAARLIWFENLLSFSVMVVGLYWLLELQVLGRDLLVVPIAGLLLWLSSLILKRFNVFNLLFQTKSGGKQIFRYIFGIVIIAIVTLISFYSAYALAEPANKLLDAIQRALDFIK
jgi:membrane-associated HD superfamily phosphohydrolase